MKPLNELKNVTDSTFTAIFGRNACYACRNLKWDDALAAAEDTMPKDFALGVIMRDMVQLVAAGQRATAGA